MQLRKRHKAWSNSPRAVQLSRGVLKKHQRQSCVLTTTKQSWKNGRKTYCGNKHLKGTQTYPLPFGLKVVQLMPRIMSSAVGFSVSGENSIDVLAEFASMPWGDLWPEAKLLDACIYLRGSIHLATSARWKAVFPTTYPL